MSGAVNRRLRPAAVAVLGVLALGACGVSAGVETSRADAIGDSPPPTADPDDTVPDDTTDTSDPTGTTDPGGQPPDSDLLDFGDDKEPRSYDDYLVRSLEDVEAWWTVVYPELYDEPFEPLQGDIYAGYPGRDDIPGCAPDNETTYDELQLFAAFYCPSGDFMAYDDGEQGVLNQLATEFGPSILGVVLAHEYGHAVQQRSGVIAQNPPTILTEQQADCFAGAWAGHVNRGEVPGLEFTDADIRSGLIAMITVRDPVGFDQFEPGGHGSAFDRVGAFQVGFSEGPQRCAPLIEDPLRLMPNAFNPFLEPSNPEGNSPFGYGEDQIAGFVAENLNAFWGQSRGVPELTVVPFSDPDEVSCDEELRGDNEIGALLCESTSTVYLDDPLALQRYEDFGDFAVGYMLASAWTEAAQIELDSPLEGEDRALLNDCLTGAWAATLVPKEDGTTNSATSAVIEPGDLDEAIQTALVAGDATGAEDVIGSPFEKIASFRQGVLDGVDGCRNLLGG